jgi:lysophospholipase L1-like esterase
VKQKSFDVAFIGDSFTEGIGLPYEKTFVGMVANQLPNLTIANLGVVSYSPAIYLSKLTYLFAQGYRFKHIIVFIDIGDVYDEANEYDLFENQFVVAKGETYPFTWFKQVRRWAIRNLPLTAMGWDSLQQFSAQRTQVIHDLSTATATAAVEQIAGNDSLLSRDLGTRMATTDSETTQDSSRRIPLVPSELKEAAARNIYEGIYERNYPKSEWTYNITSVNYGQEGVLNTLEKMRREINQLVSMATAYGATVSIGVYPWPGQLKYDTVNSLQVQFWKDFCTGKCLRFYDVFPQFFQLAEEKGTQRIIDDYYFAGDVHFTEQGNKVIADAILKLGIGAR